jgi:hypothetical protein
MQVQGEYTTHYPACSSVKLMCIEPATILHCSTAPDKHAASLLLCTHNAHYIT